MHKKYIWGAISIIVVILLSFGVYRYMNSPEKIAEKVITEFVEAYKSGDKSKMISLYKDCGKFINSSDLSFLKKETLSIDKWGDGTNNNGMIDISIGTQVGNNKISWLVSIPEQGDAFISNTWGLYRPNLNPLRKQFNCKIFDIGSLDASLLDGERSEGVWVDPTDDSTIYSIVHKIGPAIELARKTLKLINVIKEGTDIDKVAKANQQLKHLYPKLSKKEKGEINDLSDNLDGTISVSSDKSNIFLYISEKLGLVYDIKKGCFVNSEGILANPEDESDDDSEPMDFHVTTDEFGMPISY